MHPKITPLYGIDPCERFDLEKADIILTNLAKKKPFATFRQKPYFRNTEENCSPGACIIRLSCLLAHKSIWFSHFFLESDQAKVSWFHSIKMWILSIFFYAQSRRRRQKFQKKKIVLRISYRLWLDNSCVFLKLCSTTIFLPVLLSMTKPDKKSAYCIFLSIFDIQQNWPENSQTTPSQADAAAAVVESIGHSGQIFR